MVRSLKFALCTAHSLLHFVIGRGLARSRVFAHVHEQESGRTSSQSHHIMGFNKDKEAVYQNHNANVSAAQKTKSWSKVPIFARVKDCCRAFQARSLMHECELF